MALFDIKNNVETAYLKKMETIPATPVPSMTTKEATSTTEFSPVVEVIRRVQFHSSLFKR